MSTTTRDISAARAAYESGDRAASAAIHSNPRLRKVSPGSQSRYDQCYTSSNVSSSSGSLVAAASAALGEADSANTRVNPSEPGHVGGATTWQKCVVYSGLEGVALTTTIISASLATGASTSNTFAVALSCLFGISVAAAIRDYVRYESDREFYVRERQREEWELDNFPEGEIGEMVELLHTKGVPEYVAEDTMKRLAKYTDFFVDFMMAMELNMQAPDFSPKYNAITTGFSTFAFGAIPCCALLVYIYIESFFTTGVASRRTALGASVSVLTFFAILMILGVTKTNLLPQHKPFLTNVLMFSACILAAGASCVIVQHASTSLDWICMMLHTE